MTLLQSIILGIVQGLTEFLPVSSSAHLVLVPYILGWNIPPQDAFIFDVLVQVFTLLAVIVYYWRDLVGIIRSVIQGLVKGKPFEEPEARLGWLIVLASVPAGLFGVAFKDQIEAAFSSPVATAIFLFFTAALLLVAERAGRRLRSLADLNWKDALWIGSFQAISVFPGVSRSGSTIAGGMTRDLERPASARFSFLMSIPIMLAAGLLASLDLVKIPSLFSLLPVYIPGFIVAALVGYLAIRWLIGYLTHHPLYIFSIYCTLLGILILVLNFLRR